VKLAVFVLAAVVVAAGACAHEQALSALPDPLSADEHLDLGRALAVSGDIEGARRELTVAADAEPRDPRPLRHLGDAFLRAGRPAEAERAYQGSLARAATPEAENNLAIALLERGAAGDALAHARRAQALETESDRRAHIDDTVLRAATATRAPEAPVLVLHDDAGPRFVYAGRTYAIGADGQPYLDVMASVPAARAATERYSQLHVAARGTVVFGASLFGAGLFLLGAQHDWLAGGGMTGGGALMVGLGLRLDREAERELDAAARVFNERARSITIPVLAGEF